LEPISEEDWDNAAKKSFKKHMDELSK